MRAHKPNTDCEVELSVFANGNKCPEFIIPSTEDEPTAAICFIPILDDATITIQGTVSGSLLFGRVDVLADGSFVANRVIEGPESKEGILKYFDKRRVEVKTFLNVPDLSDHKPRLRPKVVEGNLVSKRLSRAMQASRLDGGEDVTGVGVGSLTLVVSLNQEAFDTYGEEGKPAYSDVTLGSWRDRVSDVKDSGIRPSHEMAMSIFSDSNPVKDKRATLFWRDRSAVRYGEAAWAYFIFYYRTQEAIDAAGCVPLTESKALPPDSGMFTRARDQVKAGDERPPLPALSAPPSTPQAPPERKKVLGLGQPLLLPKLGHFQQPPGLPTHDNESVPSVPIVGTKENNNRTPTPTLPRTEEHLDHRQSPITFPKAAQQPVQLPRYGLASQPPTDLTPRMSLAAPLFSGPPKKTRNPDEIPNPAQRDLRLDDLAAPSLPPVSLRPATHRLASATSLLSATRPSCIPSKRTKSPTQESPRGRTATRAEGCASTDPTLHHEDIPTPAKRAKLDDLAVDNACLEAEAEVKPQREAATQRRTDEERRARAEAERRRRFEENRRALAINEASRAEAVEAEREAPRRKAEAEYQDVATSATSAEAKRRRHYEENRRALAMSQASKAEAMEAEKEALSREAGAEDEDMGAFAEDKGMERRAFNNDAGGEEGVQ